MRRALLNPLALIGSVLGMLLMFGLNACSSEHTPAPIPQLPVEPPNPFPARDHVSPFLPVATVDADAPLDLTPSPSIDERRFLTHRLYYLGLQVPSLTSDGASDEYSRIAVQVGKIKSYAIATNSGSEIVASCDEFLKLLDERQHCLTGYATDQEKQERIDRDGMGAAVAGSVAAGIQAESFEAALITGAFASLHQLQESDARKQALTQAQTARTAEVYRSGARHIAEIDVHLSRLADQCRWPAGAMARWTTSTMTVDSGTDLFARFLGEAQRRPDDPFMARETLLLLANRTPGHQGRFGQDERVRLLKAVDLCLSRVSLIPASRVFDDDRIAFLGACAHALLIADTGTYVTSGYRDGATTSGKLLRRVLANYRALADDDPSDLHFYTAHALASSGDLPGAIQSMGDRMRSAQQTTDDCVYYAGLLGAHGDFDLGMKWVEHAIAHGYSNFKVLMADRDIYLLLKAYPERWKTATTPAWSWSVTWGIFQDDVILTNTSSFPLTNVTIKPAITVGGVVNTPALAPIAELKPGASYTWSNCMSLDKDKVTSKIATLVCDQVVP